MLKLILTMTASKNTGPENPLMAPMRRRPGTDKSLKDRSPDARSACFKAPSIFLKFQISEGTGLAWEEGVMGTARAVQQNLHLIVNNVDPTITNTIPENIIESSLEGVTTLTTCTNSTPL